MNTPTATVEWITPEQATTYLGLNTRNRHINIRIVAKYAHDMNKGQWQMAGEPIKFAEDGSLLDGQHRLHAIISTCLTVPMLVVRGLASGKPRGLSGQLQIAGRPNAHRLAAAARLAHAYETGQLFNAGNLGNPVSTSDLLAFVDLNPDLGDAVNLLPNNYRQKIDANPAVIIAFIWITRGIDAEASDRFMYQMSTKEGLPKGSPILALDTRLREITRTRAHLTGPAALSLFIRAWNAWRLGKSVTLFRTHVEGSIVRFEAVL